MRLLSLSDIWIISALLNSARAAKLGHNKLTLDSVVLQASGNVLSIAGRPSLTETVSTTTITAVTTNPTVTCATNEIKSVDWFNNQRMIKVDIRCSPGSIGSGDYLISLPTGIQFNPTHDPFYTGSSQTAIVHGLNAISVRGMLWLNDRACPVAVVPYDATHFRLLIYTGHGAYDRIDFVSSSWGQLDQSLRLGFEFEIAY